LLHDITEKIAETKPPDESSGMLLFLIFDLNSPMKYKSILSLLVACALVVSCHSSNHHHKKKLKPGKPIPCPQKDC